MEHKVPDTPWHVGYAKKKDDDPEDIKQDAFIMKRGIAAIKV